MVMSVLLASWMGWEDVTKLLIDLDADVDENCSKKGAVLNL